MPFSKKLIATLKLISKKDKELDNLRKFVHHCYPVADKVAVAIFDYWDVELKNDCNALDNENAWKKIFPAKKYLSDTFRTYCSKLNELIEYFLILEQFKEDKIMQQQLLATALQKKNKHKKVDEAYGNSKILIDESPLSATKSLHLTQFYEGIFYQNTNKKLNNEDETLDYFFKNLDDFYFIQKLKFANAALAHGTVFDKKTTMFLLDEILKIASQKTDNELITIYFNLLKLYQKDNQLNYNIAKNYFDKHKEKIAPDEQKIIYNHLQNFLTRKNNQGEEWVKKPLFDIKKETFLKLQSEDGISNKKALKQGLTETSFINMVSAACIAGELDFCTNFIKDYQFLIKTDNREIVISLAEANLYFYRFLESKTPEYLEFILAINQKITTMNGDLLYNLSLRVVIAKTLFEFAKIDESYRDVLFSQLHNFKNYIHKRNLSPEKTTTYVNFCVYLEKIMLHLNNNEALLKLKIEIQSLQIINKEWLLAQC